MRRRGRPRHPDILTPREWEVLALLRDGRTNEEIAAMLEITERTAKFHVSEIMGKLGVSGRHEAAAWRPEERPWWAAALASLPLVVAAKVAAVTASLALVAGLGALAYGVLRTEGPDNADVSVQTRTPLSPGTVSIESPPPDPLFRDVPAIEYPVLTPEQIARAREITEAHPIVQGLLAGRNYSMEFGAWTTGVIVDKQEYQLIGAGGTIKFTQPIPSVEAEWPAKSDWPQYHRWPEEARQRHLPYKEVGAQTFTVQNLKEIYVSVDLVREKLVSMDTFSFVDGQTVTYPPRPSPLVDPEGEALARAIFESDDRIQEVLLGREHSSGFVFGQVQFGGKRFAYMGTGWDSSDEVEADWRILINLDLETGEYEIETIHFAAERVNCLNTIIDLDREEVMSIHPDSCGE